MTMTDEVENTGQTIVQPLVEQIGCSYNPGFLERCKDPLDREFYVLDDVGNSN